MIHTLGFNWGTDSGSTRNLSASKSISDTQEINSGPVIVNSGVTDQSLTMAFTVANVSAVFLLSTTDLTLETNSGGSPANTINLKAGIPYIWFTGFQGSNPFTTNVTGFFLTNASGQQATFNARILTH